MGNKQPVGRLDDGGRSSQEGNVRGYIDATGTQVARQKGLREKSRYGTVIVKLTSPLSNRKLGITFKIPPRGFLFHGIDSPRRILSIQKALQKSAPAGLPSCMPPAEVFPLNDQRAHKLLIIHSNGWYAIPAPETFPRHPGTCLILGDSSHAGLPFPIKVGTCFRLGSVDLVVSELRTADGEEQHLDAKMLQYLKDEALAFNTNDDSNALLVVRGGLARGEEKDDDTHLEVAEELPPSIILRTPERSLTRDDSRGEERSKCYMCYGTHDTQEDQLAAPCACLGDTRYVHVGCLRKLYHTSSVSGPQDRVIRTKDNVAPSCKVCGTVYKRTIKNPNGTIMSLFEESKGPYLSLVVVTRHDKNPSLFNTKFQLNFGRMPNAPVEDSNDPSSQPNVVVIGRDSSACSMILDDRHSVSAVHADISYSEGQFFLQDRGSSNGTMVYLHEPLELPFSHSLRLRMGRATLTVQARRNGATTMHDIFSAGRNSNSTRHPTAQEMLTALEKCGVNGRPGAACVPPTATAISALPRKSRMLSIDEEDAAAEERSVVVAAAAPSDDVMAAIRRQLSRHRTADLPRHAAAVKTANDVFDVSDASDANDASASEATASDAYDAPAAAKSEVAKILLEEAPATAATATATTATGTPDTASAPSTAATDIAMATATAMATDTAVSGGGRREEEKEEDTGEDNEDFTSIKLDEPRIERDFTLIKPYPHPGEQEQDQAKKDSERNFSAEFNGASNNPMNRPMNALKLKQLVVDSAAGTPRDLNTEAA